MAPTARMIGFLMSSIGVQLASGVGLAAFLLSLALGWFRAGVFWILAPAICGAGLAAWRFRDVTSAGKVLGAQSNFFFVAFVYLLIAASGYACGALARRWRGSSRGQ